MIEKNNSKVDVDQLKKQTHQRITNRILTFVSDLN